MMRLLILLSGLISAPAAAAMPFLQADGTRIVDERGNTVMLRSMNLGGWLVQEGYMLGIGRGSQSQIRSRVEALVGPTDAERFYQAWRDNFVTRADIDALAKAGFNSLRVPLHYDLFMPPVEEEANPAQISWNSEGFRRLDQLIEWARANRMHVFLDLHAAPGGQGFQDFADRVEGRPSLFESAANQDRMVALWARLAARYANDPAVGGYDLLNEPHWDFEGTGDREGCNNVASVPLFDLYRRITAAIRAVDRRHMIVVEGNCYGNSLAGFPPPWDDNLVLSFHLYRKYPVAATMAEPLAYRAAHKVPLWLGEVGHNSNDWYARIVRFAEGEGIGWAWWTLKLQRIDSPLEIRPSSGWQALTEFWAGRGPQPSRAAARAALMRYATHDVRFGANSWRRDVIDAIMVAPHAPEASRPFSTHGIGGVRAVDYDLGPNGVAYSDTTPADYSYVPGNSRVEYNEGRTWRNDGVDIAPATWDRPVGVDLRDGEWLAYTVTINRAGCYRAQFDGEPIEPGSTMRLLDGETIKLAKGSNVLRVTASGRYRFEAFRLLRADDRVTRATTALKTDQGDCQAPRNRGASDTALPADRAPLPCCAR